MHIVHTCTHFITLSSCPKQRCELRRFSWRPGHVIWLDERLRAFCPSPTRPAERQRGWMNTHRQPSRRKHGECYAAWGLYDIYMARTF